MMRTSAPLGICRWAGTSIVTGSSCSRREPSQPPAPEGLRTADHEQATAGVVNVLGKQGFLNVVQSAFASGDVGENDGVITLELDRVVGEFLGVDGIEVDTFIGQCLAEELGGIGGVGGIGVIDNQDTALALDEGEGVGGFVVELGGNRR